MNIPVHHFYWHHHGLCFINECQRLDSFDFKMKLSYHKKKLIIQYLVQCRYLLSRVNVLVSAYVKEDIDRPKKIWLESIKNTIFY
ncbi:hypothetical protein KFK09_004804 [Dendrobium nobile]|uniref:Uncharacterized protein n=1 Tax=Dendrobium nobile TaxID=94219 RepID=A0A8T3BZ80_DENNO|nr:hypothetical protein KFK09_004804 [Dendrobium nobile]